MTKIEIKSFKAFLFFNIGELVDFLGLPHYVAFLPEAGLLFTALYNKEWVTICKKITIFFSSGFFAMISFFYSDCLIIKNKVSNF